MELHLTLWRLEMRALPWILVGVGVGLGVTFLLSLDQPEVKAETEVESDTGEVESETGDDGVESVAEKTYGWGSKTRVGRKVQSATGG
jgi:hypothetical protein